ncbi:hypothetical protein B0H67DRAFT_554900 [Lasiosphaeris hirsuta]|uniref:Rhodopsin domain-containing protein n=1 Tax=Lasiosphaeris hirsuta TaxID=260670 RepID=A0AA40A7Q7_9PEZI|nr:hypothetical protein B0H67DRAFT_554900 [Lasiosphaeris hirsuta]
MSNGTFTTFTVAVNEVAKNGSNYLDPEVAAALTPDEVATAVYGSKMVLFMELSTLTTVWLVKACLLFLYYRLTKEAFEKQKLAVKILAIFCAIGYVLVVVLCLTYWCQPIEQYWAVPVVDSECATYYNHMKFATSFNISSDLLLLLIPLPIIIRTRLPVRRKVILCLVLGLGIFNIIAAVLNRYYNFSNPNDMGYTYWYVGEVAISIYVGNVPLCWPLIRRVFHTDTWSDTKDLKIPGVGKTPPLPRKPPRKGLYSSLWLTTIRQTQWDKMDDTDDRRDGRHHDVETATEIRMPSQGSEIELTPAWQHRANTTAINGVAIGVGTGADTGSINEEVDGDGHGVMVIKTVRVSRG